MERSSSKGRVTEIIEKEIEEIKKDIIYLCKASLDFLEMGEPILSRYLAEQAGKLIETYLKAKTLLEEQNFEDEALIESARTIEKAATLF